MVEQITANQNNGDNNIDLLPSFRQKADVMRNWKPASVPSVSNTTIQYTRRSCFDDQEGRRRSRSRFVWENFGIGGVMMSCRRRQ